MTFLLSDRLSPLARRRWRRLEQRMERIDDDERLAVLQALARDHAPVAVAGPIPRAPLVGPVELRIGTRRVGVSRVHGRAWKALQAAAAGGAVTLAGARRYGPGWVLVFAGHGDQPGPAARLALLAERVRLLPEVASGRNRSDGPPARLAS